MTQLYKWSEHTSDTPSGNDGPQDNSEVCDGDLIAAVDLGSNSFHSVIARNQSGTLTVVDRIKDMVRLAEGFDNKRQIRMEAQERALDSLRRIGDRLRTLPPTHVRVVGTNTLRAAKDSKAFLARAEEALGHDIQIISGFEEARLVYLGVAHTIGKSSSEKRLVIDIGGGSTEIIIGRGFDPMIADSTHMGCVSYTQRFFKDGKISKQAFSHAEVAAQQELQSLSKVFRDTGWDLAVGSSGTAKAIADTLLQNGLSDGSISLDSMKALRKQLIKIGDISKISIPGLSERRVPVFVGGLSILIGCFKSLKITRMIVSDGALREGLLYDLIGRMGNADRRDQTVRELAKRYSVDVEQGGRVEQVALNIYRQVASVWKLDRNDICQKMLKWSSEIHEIGLAISHASYHKHGSYIVENSDMSGFSRGDQKFLWAMIRSQKRELKLHRFSDMPLPYPTLAPRLTIILRLAIILCRGRQESVIPEFKVYISKKNTNEINLLFPQGFLQEHPLLDADLSEEMEFLKAAGFTLTKTDQ